MTEAKLDSEEQGCLFALRSALILLVVLIVAIAGSCSFNHYQDRALERACIDAGRSMWAGHCHDAPER